MAIPLIAGAMAAPIIGGLIGASEAEKQRSQANELTKQQMEAWKNLALPEFGDLKYERFKKEGDLTPEAETAEQLSMIDQLQNVNLDPRLRTAQMSALDTLQKLGQTGMTPEQRAELGAIQRKTEADNQARLQALLQQQDSRGVGSSDMALAMRALEAQGAANRQAEASQNTAARGFQQALQAIANSGSLAGNIEQQDYSRAANIADAQRNRELQNLNQRAGVQQRNVSGRNTAQQFNLAQAQDISNKNVGLSGTEAEYNAFKRPQMAYDAALARTQGLTGALNTGASAANSSAAATGQMWSGIGGGIGQILGSDKFSNLVSPAAETKPTIKKP